MVVGDACAACGGTDLTNAWEGYIIIESIEGSEVAKAINATAPGKFALKIK